MILPNFLIDELIRIPIEKFTQENMPKEEGISHLIFPF